MNGCLPDRMYSFSFATCHLRDLFLGEREQPNHLAHVCKLGIVNRAAACLSRAYNRDERTNAAPNVFLVPHGPHHPTHSTGP